VEITKNFKAEIFEKAEHTVVCEHFEEISNAEIQSNFHFP
jgi:hypothetical protein